MINEEARLTELTHGVDPEQTPNGIPLIRPIFESSACPDHVHPYIVFHYPRGSDFSIENR